MAGGERPHLNRNESAEQQNLKEAQKGDQHTAKLQQDGLFGQGVEKAKGTDAAKEVAEGIQLTAERIALAHQRLQEAANDPVKGPLLAGLLKQSEGYIERPLLVGLYPTDDPVKKQQQQELMALIQSGGDKTKFA